MQYSGEFTCVKTSGQDIYGSDTPKSVPRPVHKECWEFHGRQDGWTREAGCKKFVVGRKWYESLPEGTKCYICGKVI